ncbi:actin-related protein 8 [Nilaparvata lugens]|uniref:actin-related protein 8 n=1 Tax=Nilaparvata lugens TaxID=108931 RepID=UPI00193C962F|nr:actin-related protein 8 [Nilaparvata lugens]
MTFQDTTYNEHPAHKVIIIHPGSLYVQIGRASDVNPHTELHAIARKRLIGGQSHHDLLLPPTVKRSTEVAQEMDEVRLQISHTLQSCLQSDGRRRYATPPQQIAAFNRQAKPAPVTTPCSTSDQFIKPEKNIVVGNEVLYLDPALDFNVHFPIKRGDLNVHNGVGGSLTAVLADLQAIWSFILEYKFGISHKDFKSYRAILIIPDIYNRLYLRELMTLLLNNMGFGACFLIQDHVAATFGAGLGCACVVDVGHQKTSVSCVEDGISHPATRVRLGYGGGDITHAFHWLLQKCAFPYKACDPNQSPRDALLLQQLKHDCCHINLDVCGSSEKSFVVQHPNSTSVQYTIQMADECLIAPLSLFQPELLGVTGPKTLTTQKRSTGDPQDPHDADYLRETSRRGLKEAMEANSEGGLGVDGGAGAVAGEEDIVVDNILEGVQGGGGSAPLDSEFTVNSNQLLGLDQAILQSIDRCVTDDLKRKMYASILVVGGGLKFHGINTWLHNKLSLQVPYMLRSEQMDIVTNAKDMDPQITAWKGASVLCCLESVHELWIKPSEWDKYSVKLLREKACFMW